MKKIDITTVLLNLILLAYFIYFNVVYIFPLFYKKTENFQDKVDHTRELEILEEQILKSNNLEDLKRNEELLKQYRLAFKNYQKNNKENSLNLDKDYIGNKINKLNKDINTNINNIKENEKNNRPENQ